MHSLPSKRNVMKNEQHTNIVQKDFNANCKENYGEINMHSFASSKKECQCGEEWYVFFHACKKLLEHL
jgi:hypothetical protein